jgi:ATP-binding cassette subfamily C protein
LGVIILGIMTVSVVLASSSLGEAMAQLALLLTALMRLLPSLQRIVSQAGNIRGGTAAAEELERDLADTLTPHAGETALELPRDWRSISVRNLNFRFTDDGPQTLDGIDFKINRGESIGVVGPSGSGKSTLFKVMLGLLPPSSGEICIDDIRINARMGAWRKRIGFVPQEVELLDDTLSANIALGEEPHQVDADRTWRALRLANLETFVASLPDGVETPMGERGARLSGGQRQRVGIARALYHEPDLLMFDEATSALDNESERELTAAIHSLAGERTLIIIAHRLSTIRNCSRIIFLSAGRVVDIGSYDELVERSPEFRRFAQETGAVADLTD